MVPRLLALLLLCAPCPAQESEPEVLLEAETTFHDAVFRALRLFTVDIDPDMPDLDAGDVLRLRFLSDGRTEMTKAAPRAKDDRTVLQLDMRPGPVKQRLKEAAGVVGGLWRASVFSLFVLEYNAEPRYVARAMKAVTDFPFQVERLRVTIKRRKDFKTGHVVDAWLQPKPGTWFDRITKGIEPSQTGAHLLRTPDAALSIAVAVDGPERKTLIAPFGDMLAKLRGRTKAERKAFRALCAARADQLDASFSLLIDGPGRYVRLVGVQPTAAKTYATQSLTPVATEFDMRRLGVRKNVQIAETLPDPLTGTGLRMTIADEDVFEVITEESQHELATFRGVIRDFGVKVRWPQDGVEVARLVERIEKRRLRRLPLPDGALLMAELQFGAGRLRKQPRAELATARFGEFLGNDAIADFLDALPERVELTVHKRMHGDAAGLRVYAVTR